MINENYLTNEVYKFHDAWCVGAGEITYADVTGNGVDDMICDYTANGYHYIRINLGNGEFYDPNTSGLI